MPRRERLIQQSALMVAVLISAAALTAFVMQLARSNVPRAGSEIGSSAAPSTGQPMTTFAPDDRTRTAEAGATTTAGPGRSDGGPTTVAGAPTPPPKPTPTPTTRPPATTTPTARPTTATSPISAPPPLPLPAMGFPTAANTGVRAATALSPSGSITTSGNGQVIANLDVSGRIQVLHSNVTIRNVRVRNSGGQAISTLNTTGLLVEDCELDGTGNSDASSAIGEHNYTMRRCNVHHFGEGPRINGGVVLEDNYLHDFLNFVSVGAHQDCIQVTSGYDITIRHNTCIIGVDGANAAIMIGSYQGGNILVENNLLGGGGYSAYCGGTNGYTNVRYLNNRFTTAYYPRSGYHGPFLYCENATLSGNVWHDGPNANQTVT